MSVEWTAWTPEDEARFRELVGEEAQEVLAEREHATAEPSSRRGPMWEAIDAAEAYIAEHGPGDEPLPRSNGRRPVQEIRPEPWAAFRDKTTEIMPMLVERVWPVGAMGFIAGPPKGGKTWLALALALSIATGRDFAGAFPVARRGPVLYVALEGARAGLRARVGALARGLDLDLDGNELDGLEIAYKPAGMNLSDEAWADRLVGWARDLDAVAVVVDVLRRACR